MSPSAPRNGVITSDPPASEDASPSEETVTSMREPERTKGGRLAVTITAATFLARVAPVSVAMPRLFSMERIDCSAYETVDLIVRVHTDASVTPDSKLSIELVSDGYTADDPSQSFFSGVLDSNPIVFAGADVPSAGDIAIKTYTSGLGAMLAVRVKGEQSNSAGTDVTARISIELALREC